MTNNPRQHQIHILLDSINLKDAEELLRHTRANVSLDDARAVCKITDAVYERFTARLFQKLDVPKDMMEKMDEAFFSAADDEARDKIYRRSAFEAAARFVLKECTIVWLLMGLPSDFTQTLRLPSNVFSLYDPLVWRCAILNALHPPALRGRRIARHLVPSSL